MPADLYFDLDGTLTDPFEGISKSIVYALERMGEPAPDDAMLRQCIGPPLLDSFATLVGTASAATALTYYRERFGDTGWQENIAYAGIQDVLAQLMDTENVLYVATSKPRIFAERIVEHFELAPYFERVFGSELDGTRTNKVELLKFALNETGSANATMIGDRKHDAIGAFENDMEFVGVTYGYGSEAELRAAGTTRFASSPADIPARLLSQQDE